MIDNRLAVTKDLIIILSVSEHDSYHMLYFTVRIWPDRPEQSVDPDVTLQKAVSHQGLHCLPLIQLF